MTRDEILKKSREENSDKDIFDLEVQKTAAIIAYYSSFAICVLVSLLNWIFARKISVQCWIVFFGMLSVAFFVKFFKMKKLHELFVALGYFAVFACLVAVLILRLAGKIGAGL